MALGVAAGALGLVHAAQDPDDPAAPLPAPSPAASQVFRRFSDRVVKIQVLETGSSAKATLGSGFYVDADGRIVTNYHVISKIVHRPERYRAEVHDAGGAVHTAVVLGIDVIHDLAILQADARPRAHFAMRPVDLSRGDRLYSLGHPRDLGLSIIEGTYNGLLQYTLYPKIHFSGSLNPGMSGGPAIDGGGRVVGVNVSTAGNQVSFLVPIERAVALLDTVIALGRRPAPDFVADVRRQVAAYQEEYLARVFATDSSIVMSGFRVPTSPAPFFKCWADLDENDERPYEITRHYCSTDDEVYITEDQSTGIIEIEHRLLTSRTLNPFRFSALYTYQFDAGGEEPWGDEDEVTKFRCRAENVRTGGATVRAAFCVRRYRNLPGLYDAVVRSAVLGTGRSGIVSVMELSGVSFENAQRVARQFLERIAWPSE